MTLRRLVDILVSLVALIVFAPLLVAIAVIVRVCLGPRVIFRQIRPGLHGEPLEAFAFGLRWRNPRMGIWVSPASLRRIVARFMSVF